MTFPIELCILFGVSILVSSVGFYRFTLFRSVGYGISIAACCVVLTLLFHEKADMFIMAVCGLIIFYGITATVCLVREDVKKAARRKRANRAADSDLDDMGLKIVVWTGCGVLYALMVSPLCYRLVNGDGVDNSVYVGGALIAVGALLKYVADLSGARQRKKYPGQVCLRGIYRFVRCPGCFGEILLWTGVFLVGITSFQSAGQWILSGLGYAGIVFAEFCGARRIEMRQNRLFGDDPRYTRYVRRVPVIVPLLPLYSLEKWRFLAF